MAPELRKGGLHRVGKVGGNSQEAGCSDSNREGDRPYGRGPGQAQVPDSGGAWRPVAPGREMVRETAEGPSLPATLSDIPPPPVFSVAALSLGFILCYSCTVGVRLPHQMGASGGQGPALLQV